MGNRDGPGNKIDRVLFRFLLMMDISYIYTTTTIVTCRTESNGIESLDFGE